MAQKKAHEVDSFLKRLDRAYPIVLLYGPDKGLVSERAGVFIKLTGLAQDDPFAVIPLDADDINAEPGRLSDEANTISMFGGERLIWVRNAAGQKGLADAVAYLCKNPPADTFILVEAGDLKKGAGLRGTVEQSASAMALPCYSDDARGIDSTIDDMLARNGLQITLDARGLLKESLGGDRLATRAELEKVCLYAHGKERITVDDVRDIVGDVSATSYETMVDAVMIGNVTDFTHAFDRVIGTGSASYLILSAAIRQFQSLQTLRYGIENEGKNAASAVATARPPVFFARKKFVETALQRWTTQSCARAIERLQRTVLESRRNAPLAIAIIRQSMIALAAEAARAGRNGR
ncbi:DNA polymerase III subunit delta [Phyllobacterium brassicacearum]|uniref:DNA-directed DNA polymerase n=1 Tax=Phyllobacterium brassicacearum TaxID=314235 RepID=A0A2P7BBL3_9HYPH|nr:DNA polymerase III subunit delta [Phyllobacterium brassicacearum]PSH63822.1 DNA polymerase III subunit delta [Phyllobacterium brassicacearum]TDQ20115.1 DNA polymerase III delta subunit [Phyllobacterium brassicacearum]